MSDWPGSIAAVTLFVEDLDAARTTSTTWCSVYPFISLIPIRPSSGSEAPWSISLVGGVQLLKLSPPGSVAPARAGARLYSLSRLMMLMQCVLS